MKTEFGALVTILRDVVRGGDVEEIADVAKDFLVVGLGELEGDELDVIGHVVGRLLIGRERYGQLDIATDPRTWREEKREELLDALIYGCIDELQGELE